MSECAVIDGVLEAGLNYRANGLRQLMLGRPREVAA